MAGGGVTITGWGAGWGAGSDDGLAEPCGAATLARMFAVSACSLDGGGAYRQRLDGGVWGGEAAWVFFGGVFKVLIPDNMSPIVSNADPVNPTLTIGWLDYAQARGFVTDPARVRSPKDKPRVERIVQYVRGNSFAGEVFVNVADARRPAARWSEVTTGLRVQSPTAPRPADPFAATAHRALLRAPARHAAAPLFPPTTPRPPACPPCANCRSTGSARRRRASRQSSASTTRWKGSVSYSASSAWSRPI